MWGEPWVIAKGPWEARLVCAVCRQYLTTHEIYYSDGVCPRCGHDSDGTVCDTQTVIWRWVETESPSWWERWFLRRKPQGYWEIRHADPTDPFQMRKLM